MKVRDILFPGSAMQRRQAERNAQKPPEERLYARFAPGAASAIHLYADGRIESRWGNGSILGATAAVQPGAHKKVMLTVVGPDINLAVDVLSTVATLVRGAHQFAGNVNQLAAKLQ